MRVLLLARAGAIGLSMIGVAVVGAARLLVMAAEGVNVADPTATYVQGGIAVAAIGFAGAVVKFMGALNDKERARGDRLEAAALGSVTANAASNAAMDKMGTAMTEIARRFEDLARNQGRPA